MTMQYLIENGGFIGGKTKELLREIKAIKFSRRQEDFNEDSQDCLQLAQNLMPYGTGYIYIKNMASLKKEINLTNKFRQTQSAKALSKT